jgi:hypothetical protein
MKLRQFSLLLVIAALAGTFAACGSSSSHPLAIAFSSTPPAAMTADTPLSLTATVTNDPKSGGVDWTVSCSTSSCGSFSASHTTSGTATTYTAPTVPPTGGVTIKAASTTDSTKTVSATITISPSGPLADGTYVFQLSGADTNNGGSPFYAAGVFVVSQGAITNGEEDFADSNGGLNIGISPASSGITVSGSDTNLQIVLSNGTGSIGVPDNNGGSAQTLNLTLTSATSGVINEFDAFGTGSGTLSLQQASAAQTTPANGYAFLASGWDFNLSPLAVGGIINVDGPGTISGTGSVYDFNDTFDSGVSTDNAFDSTSTVSAPDTLGHVVFTLDSGGAFMSLGGYIIDSNTIALVELSDLLGGTTGGTAYAQGTNTGGFSSSSPSISGDTNGFLNFAGSVTFNADGTVSGNATFNDFTNQISGAISTGNYTVDPTGRITVTALTVGGFTANFQFYVDGNGNATAASMDANDVTAGPAFLQTPSATISGNYGLTATGVGNNGLWSAVGPVSVSSGAIGNNSFNDFNYLDLANQVSFTDANVPLSGTLASGNSTITGLGADALENTGTSGPNDFIFYVIDGNRAWGIESDNVQLGLLFTQLQH